jgi:RNA polymerase sigma-70 factor (ECF subfamily)
MARIIEHLNDKFRIPFKMHLHGTKYKEISVALNLNIGTVKSRIFYQENNDRSTERKG